MSTTFFLFSLLQAVAIASAKPISRRQNDVSTAWNETAVWDPTSIKNITVTAVPSAAESPSVPTQTTTAEMTKPSLLLNETSIPDAVPVSAANETTTLPDVISFPGNSSVAWNGTTVSYDNTTVVEFGNYTFTPQNITLLPPDLVVNITQPFYLKNATISSANGATQTLLINGTVITFNNVTGTLIIPFAVDTPSTNTNWTVPMNYTTVVPNDPSASAAPVWIEPSATSTSAWAEPSATTIATEPASAPSTPTAAIEPAPETPSGGAESGTASEVGQPTAETAPGPVTDETPEPAATVTLYVTETEAETQTQTQTQTQVETQIQTQTQTQTIYQTATQTATQTTSVFVTETAPLPTMALGLIPVEKSDGSFEYSISQSLVSTYSPAYVTPTSTVTESTATGTATGRDTVPPTLTDSSVIASLLPTSTPAFTYTLSGVNDTLTIGAPLPSASASAPASASAVPDWTSVANGTLAGNETSAAPIVTGEKNVTVGIVIPAGSNWTEPAESYAPNAALLNVTLSSMVDSAQASTETAASSPNAVTRRFHRTSPWARVRKFRN